SLIPPAPIVSWLPPILKAPAVLSNDSDEMLQATSTFELSPTAPEKRMAAVPLFAGEPDGFQLLAVPQLPFTPSPSQVVPAKAPEAAAITPSATARPTNARAKAHPRFFPRFCIKTFSPGELASANNGTSEVWDTQEIYCD